MTDRAKKIVDDHLLSQTLVSIHREVVLSLNAEGMAAEEVATIQNAINQGKIRIGADASFWSRNNSYRIFNTLIDGVSKEVWRIPGVLHPLQVANDELSEYWIRLEEGADPGLANTDEGNGEWQYYLGHHMHRGCWGIQIQDDHGTKVKWDELNINKRVMGTLTYNKVPVSKIRGRDATYVLARLELTKIRLIEHSLPLLDFAEGYRRGEVIGRRLYWDDQPAVVDDLWLADDRIALRYVGEPQRDVFGKMINGFLAVDRADRDDQEEGDDFPLSEWHGQTVVHDSFLDTDYSIYKWHRQKLYPGDDPDRDED